MRVLMVNDYAEKGGAEVVMHAQADALRARSHDVEVFTGEETGLKPGPIAYIDSLPARRVLSRALGAFDPDVVHLHNFYHLLSPGILGTLGKWKHRKQSRRVVMTVHDYHLVCPNAGMRRFGGWLTPGPGSTAAPEHAERWGSLLATRWDHRGVLHPFMKLAQHVWNYRVLGRRRAIDAALAPSRHMAAAVERGLRTIPADVRPAVSVVPNPLELGDDLGLLSGMNTIDAAHGSNTTENAERPFTLLFAGRVEPEKGLPGFIGHLAGETGVRLEIVGDGEQLGACAAAGREAGVEIITHGRLPHAATLARMAASDAVVLPSVWPENAPVSLFEALAMRRPILVSDAGGMREIVEDFRVGARFDPHDREAVRRALRSVRTEPAPPEAWQRVARMLADRTPARHAERLESVYAGA